MTDAEKRELIKHLQNQFKSTGAKWYISAAAAIEATLWKPIADMPDELKDGRRVDLWDGEIRHTDCFFEMGVFFKAVGWPVSNRMVVGCTHYMEITAPEVE